MKIFLYCTFFFLSSIGFAANLTPADGIERLKQGNERFVQSKLLHPDRDWKSRAKTEDIQTPFAIILGCSDSRVPPEILFDQGIGDLFVVRVAGNVAGPVELDSIEYAALYLGSKSLLVLGHENCGAVGAVLDGKTKDIENVAKLIEPAVKEAKNQAEPSLENAIKDNVKHVVEALEKAPVLADLIKKNEFAIVGGYYNLSTGKVQYLK